jgi:RNA polymerase sigma-70 factor (ECF subfamily)
MTEEDEAASEAPPSKDTLASTFMEFRSHLERLVAGIVGTHSVEDIVQETFVRSYEASRKQAINHPRSFMWKTAKNIALNHALNANNKLTNVADFSDPDVYLPADCVELERELEAKERFEVFRAAIETLPLQCRRAFTLKKIHGLSQREIATQLGISESTVEKQVAKGLLMCARFMDAKGYPVDTARDRRQQLAREKKGA